MLRSFSLQGARKWWCCAWPLKCVTTVKTTRSGGKSIFGAIALTKCPLFQEGDCSADLWRDAKARNLYRQRGEISSLDGHQRRNDHKFSPFGKGKSEAHCRLKSEYKGSGSAVNHNDDISFKEEPAFASEICRFKL